MTRTVNGTRCLNDVAKEVLRKQIHQVAAFCGVELITFAVMSNHFHVLLRVPPKPVALPDAELMRRYRILYPKPTKHAMAHVDVLAGILDANGPEADVLRTRLLKLMHDVSAFMKLLKQRFSVWYNRTHRRYGTLWSERFRSVLVEGCPMVIRTVAAYIDLNAVRAGLCEDPATYRFCGYGEVAASGRCGDLHLEKTSLSGRDAESEKALLAGYRLALFAKGTVAKAKGGVHAQNLPADAHAREQSRAGALPLATRLRLRSAWFTQGAVLGTEAFVSEALADYRARTGRRRRCSPKSLAAAEPGTGWPNLFALRGHPAG